MTLVPNIPASEYWGRRSGGAYLDPAEASLPSVSTGNKTVKEVKLKSSQVMERIESAGWKRIRADGSHFVYEHPKYGRKMYAKGRPQSEVNKHRLRQIAEEFHLVEIETARIEARLAEAKRRPEPARVALARVVADPEPQLTHQEARLLFAQLHKEHGWSLFKMGTETNIESSHMVGFFHRGIELPGGEWITLRAYLLDLERRFKLSRNRADLLKKGYGARLGAFNAPDPFLAEAREAIQKTLDAGVLIVDLAETLGVHSSVIQGIKSGTVKRIYPSNKEKIQRWIDQNWAEPVAKPVVSAASATTSVIIEGPTESQEAPKVVEEVYNLDEELAAIQTVLKAVRPLMRPPHNDTAKRALRYVLERME